MSNFKFVAILFAVIILLGSCSKEDPKPISEAILKDSNTVISLKGEFASRVHQTSGKASILNNAGVFTLAIENFKTDAGPDLRVYLSATEGASDYVSLGALKSTSGTFSYPVATTTDFKKYKFVVIWCEDFSVLFGVAELK
ncbi:MAG: DM13 domain-containing protein [Cytophagales bacterium]